MARKKGAKVNQCPQTIKKTLAGEAAGDITALPVFSPLSDGHFKVSKELLNILQTPAVKKTLAHAFNETTREEDNHQGPDNPHTVTRAHDLLKMKQTAKRQEHRVRKISSSLTASNVIESARCLRDIEKALGNTDYESMFEVARDRGNATVTKLVDEYTTRTKDTWDKFCVQVMKALHGGENYLGGLRSSIERFKFKQGNKDVSSYVDTHGPDLEAILLVYTRAGIDGHMRTDLEASFGDRWIRGLNDNTRGNLLREHVSAVQKGNPMTFETIAREAAVNEQVGSTSPYNEMNERTRGHGANTATSAAANPPRLAPEQEARTTSNVDVADILSSVDNKLTENASNIQASHNAALQAFAGALTSTINKLSAGNPTENRRETAQLQGDNNNQVVCFFCQRKGLDFKHSHLTCPVRLANKRNRDQTRQQGHPGLPLGRTAFPPGFPPNPFGHGHPGPPPTPPPGMTFGGQGLGRECFRCGQTGHRAFECSQPCKVCRKVGKGQHVLGCVNTPKPRSGNGIGPRR
jgi:hypothetical protein